MFGTIEDDDDVGSEDKDFESDQGNDIDDGDDDEGDGGVEDGENDDDGDGDDVKKVDDAIVENKGDLVNNVGDGAVNDVKALHDHDDIQMDGRHIDIDVVN